MQFFPGQRWLSDTEVDLGLGTVVDVNQRQVTILFPATGETRVYATQIAPLTRLALEPDELVSSHEGWQMLITEVTENQGQLTYHGIREDNKQPATLVETFVDHNMQVNQPHKRLLNGQYDGPRWFDLRHQCLVQQYQHQTSPLLGFVGARVDLIPHQLHIARTVGQRYAPRVLLADEVGLGKTIEAAMIIHQQLQSGRASRVLIVVPDSLVHQWLVEMLRRVNLAFAIFDTERCQSLVEQGGNPFDTEQLVLCSLRFLTDNPQYAEQAGECDWDLMVVDEAHHLQWSEQAPSAEYLAIEKLAANVKGLLLLTATPEQLGHQSHFARLRLLDPDRFYDYQAFVEQEQHYGELADAIEPMLAGQSLSEANKGIIRPLLDNQQPLIDALEHPQQYPDVIRHLLDCHGTGRLLFRNSRAGISGFPVRRLHRYPLACPAIYNGLDMTGEQGLYPELQYSGLWQNSDPRISWLVDFLQQNKGEKVLAICHSAKTAMAVAEAMRVQAGIRVALFHENLSIVERDKAGSYFAQQEDGAQILVCSEIGSEGRNFQFAHHLVLFDLPAHPDLLEQRIGRLDRIGQQQDIQIHLPYFSHTAQHVMADWYHLGLNGFEHTCPSGNAVYQQVQASLLQALNDPGDDAGLSALISDTRQWHQRFTEQLEAGRDKLLELNSSGRGHIEQFVEQIRAQDDSAQLEKFMTQLFDTVGVLQEDNDESSYLLKTTEAMHHTLPGLDEEGTLVTYERATALHNEQLQFLSWDHPLVQHAQETVLTDVKGKASIGIHKNAKLPVGIFWLEALFVVSAKAPKVLQLERFLPATPLRLCIDPAGKVCDHQFSDLLKLNRKTARQLIPALQGPIEKGLEQLNQLAEQQVEEIKQQSLGRMQQLLAEELQRLQSLKQVNPSIRDEEIRYLQQQQATLAEVIARADLRFESIRLVVNTH